MTMYQQINLYQPVFRQQRKIFSAQMLLQVLVAVTLLLLAVYAHARWTLVSLNNTVASVEKQYRQLETQLGNLELTRHSSVPGGLESELARLRHSITEKQSLLDSIGHLTLYSDSGFGDFFESLTRQTQSGLWITGIHLTREGDTEIRGTTVDPELVPGYLQQMPDLPRFLSLQQGSVHLVRHEQSNAEIEFVLRSKSLEEL